MLLSILIVACGSPQDADPGPDPPPPPDGATQYHVALDGSDDGGDGTEASPWRTLSHAAASVPKRGGFEILLGSGVYDGPVVIERSFDRPITIRSAVAYGATLTNQRNGQTILFVGVQGPARLVFEQLVISNEGTSGGDCRSPAGHMIHLTNLSDVVFRDNVIQGNDRMPRCNDAIKVNLDNAQVFPTGIRFEGNFFANPPGVDGREMIDVFEPGELDIVGNIFVSDRGGPGGEAFVRLWGEWGSTSARNPRYRIQRNVFLGYEGNDQRGFLEFGGEGASIPEVSDALIENNLFVGTTSYTMAAPLVLRGVRRVTIRANTFVGDFPASAFGLALGTDGSNPAVQDVFLEGNIWFDPSGTMGDHFASVFGNVALETVQLDRNLYWNQGNPLPSLGALRPQDDSSGIVAAPQLIPTDYTTLHARWIAEERRFQSGSTTIRQELERLVLAAGALGHGSPARDAGDPDRMPTEDILGRPRLDAPDVGAFEAP